MSAATDALVASAELGEQARNFLDSELGKVLVGLADQEVLLAQEALETVSPSDAGKITELQNKAKVGRWFSQWLLDLVSDGEQAINVFKQQQETP